MTKFAIIKQELERTGRISRNFCLGMYYTRLAARITDLREEGWDFQPKDENGDYVYYAIKRPPLKQPALL